jgi:hypothetical protein
LDFIAAKSIRMKRRRDASGSALCLWRALCFFFVVQAVARDSTWEYAVRVTATVQTSPPQISLTWAQDSNGTPLSYDVSRKAVTDTSWGPATTLSGSTTTFVDSSVSVGATYEYQVHKRASDYDGWGYIYSGINVPLVENRGKVLLIVDNTFASDLSSELMRQQQDLAGDGWTVIRHDISRSDSVTSVKSYIQSQYNSDPANVNTVLLFGHVPVPYSGNIAPDEHIPAHKGAWPADVYYGDMDGTWTDRSVNTTSATDSRNWNVPGDGKFDQSTIPSNVELMVGRVDLANMPGMVTWNGPATFPSELELLRQYLNKDHNFRHVIAYLPRRALIYDGFGDYGGYAFSASSWRNFAPMFGLGNNTYLPNSGTWLDNVHANGYEMAYGCGSGEYNGINGLGHQGNYNEALTTDLVSADPQANFLLLFGSWLGDWDSQDNFQRGVLATPTYGLACCWSGSPHWYLQHMALGQTIGFGTRLTQNNTAVGLYRTQTNTYAHLVHIALLGDPTLRLHPISPPSNLTGSTNSTAVFLNWGSSPDSVLGYYVYRGSDPNGPFTRITSSLVSGTGFTDASPPTGTSTYLVRAVKLESTPSGTYFNASQGIFATLSVAAPVIRTPVTIASIQSTPYGIVLTWNSQSGNHYRVTGAGSLFPTNWPDLTSDIIASGESTSWTDTAATGMNGRFYRVFQLQ